MNELSCRTVFRVDDAKIAANSRKANLVLWITTVTMVLEIYFGYVTGSMALLADGWHMSTHAAALGITWLTYKLARSPKMVANFNFGGGKITALGGFASSVFLLLIAVFVAIESVQRFWNPVEIHFKEALLVAVIGLTVNLVCAWILREEHDAPAPSAEGSIADKNGDHSEQDTPFRHHSHSGALGHHSHSGHFGHHHSHGGLKGHHSHGGSHDDHNIRAAYIHVIADALTSVGAILALLAGQFYGTQWLDPLVGVVGSIVILRWAYGLIKDTGWILLDGHAEGVDFPKLTQRLQSENVTIIDLHVWKVGPSVLTAELIVKSATPRGIAYYRKILENEFGIHHSVIEER